MVRSTGRKVLRRFYEPLLLLKALDPIRGERIKPESIHSDSPNLQKLRRSFVDGIAYICAYKKGPDHVTAAALERTPQEVKVWLASNKNIDDSVIHMLQRVLYDVQCIARLDSRESRQRLGEQTLDRLTSDIVDFNAPRISTYYKEVALRCVPECLKVIRSSLTRNGTLVCCP